MSIRFIRRDDFITAIEIYALNIGSYLISDRASRAHRKPIVVFDIASRPRHALTRAERMPDIFLRDENENAIGFRPRRRIGACILSAPESKARAILLAACAIGELSAATITIYRAILSHLKIDAHETFEDTADAAMPGLLGLHFQCHLGTLRIGISSPLLSASAR